MTAPGTIPEHRRDGPVRADEAFAGRVALVTGAGSGVGASCAAYFARRGASVVVVDREARSAEAVARDLSRHTSVDAVEADVSTADGCTRMVEAAVSRFGGLDVAVNNAGVASRRRLPLAESEEDEWRRVLGTNLDGTYFSMRAEIAAMLQGDGGTIVNVSSVMGIVAAVGSAAYVASKHAVIGLTKSAALDYAEAGIRINSVGPGFIDTPMLGATSRIDTAAAIAKHPMNRLGSADEVAEVVGFLASPSSAFVTGAYYTVDGGYTAQ